MATPREFSKHLEQQTKREYEMALDSYIRQVCNIRGETPDNLDQLRPMFSQAMDKGISAQRMAELLAQAS